MPDWDQIMADHGPVVWRTARRMVSNHEDAADVMQEAFVAAVRMARRQKVRNWRALLIRLATVRAIDRLRSRGRERGRRTDGVDLTIVAQDGNDVDPTRPVERQELVQRLRNALTDLPIRQAEAFSLRYLSELTYREIAEEMDMETAHVGALLHRARANLRDLLSRQWAGRPE
ncbi:MAG: RNA polymerase sigma factor [Phycisphaerae bacterium]